MEYSIAVNLAESKAELDRVFDIRRVVFVEEQKVDEREEYDTFEETSKHLLAYVDGSPAGAARVRRTPNGFKLERFAVLKEHRGKGVGAALLSKALECCTDQTHVYLHAQIQVVDFYSRFGFVTEGEEFVEAGIRHYKMTFRP